MVRTLTGNLNVYRSIMRQNRPFADEILAYYKDVVMNGTGECHHYAQQNPDPTNRAAVMAVFAAVYVNLFVLGLLGNVSVVVLTLKYRHLRTVQNIFILNLALSDVIVCMLSLPFTPVTSVYKVWYFGGPICHLLPMVQAVSVLVSTLSLSAIAIDRYNLVVRPHARPLSARGARNVAAVLWVVSVAVSLPYAYYMGLEEYPGMCGQFCTESWPNKSIQRIYALVVLVLQFLLPFITMSFCYSTIFSRLRERANSKLKKLDERSQLLHVGQLEAAAAAAGHKPVARTGSAGAAAAAADDPQRASLLAQQRRTTTILASMVLIFGLTWLPQNVVTLMMEYDDTVFERGPTTYTYIVSMVAHSIAMLMNVANPVLYAWLNPTFKQLFLRAFKTARMPDSVDVSTRCPPPPAPTAANNNNNGRATSARDSVAKLETGLDAPKTEV